jgi:hypothetical protein
MIHPPHDTVLVTSEVQWLSHGRESPTWRDPPWGEFCRGDFNGGNSVGAAPSRDPNACMCRTSPYNAGLAPFLEHVCAADGEA